MILIDDDRPKHTKFNEIKFLIDSRYPDLRVDLRYRESGSIEYDDGNWFNLTSQ